MSFLQQLNSIQQEAVKATNGPVLIVAGAGSGKTRVLTYRIAHLINCGVPPYQIIALTFTNKAANEMKGRIRTLVGEKADVLWMGTFHSLFARILRKEAEAIGYSRSFTIYDSDDSLNVVKKCIEHLNLSLQQFVPTSIRARISNAKNRLIGWKEYAEEATGLLEEKAALVYAEYEKRLKQSNALDFDDLLVKPIELFKNHRKVLERYHDRFKFILVDEFQDTNRAQYEMIRLLGQRHRNICVVGDDAQSIYSFRGADIKNILDYETDYSDCNIFRLEQNYRSTKHILTVADKLIKHNIHQIKKNLWTENAPGDKVTLLECVDDKDEGYQISQLVQQEIVEGGRNLKDFAVLYRTNAQSRSIEDVLRRNSIPYTIVGGIRFYERKEIKDVIAYLRLLANAADDESFRRVVNYPPRGIGDTTLERLDVYARKRELPLYRSLDSISEIESLPDRPKRLLAQFKEFIDKYLSLKSKMSFSELSRSLVDELGILRSYKDENTTESMARWENVQELLSAITEYADEHPDGTLESFLEEVTLVADIDNWDETRNYITLMTLHASKGLEFPVVFIAGVEEGLLPFYPNQIESQELEEERRLFYVGITRAEQKLFLSKTKMRYRFGDLTYTSPSRFLSEIGEKNFELRESTSTSKYIDWSEGVGARLPMKKATQGKPKTEPSFADEMPNYEEESQEVFHLKAGSMVRHEMFGRGKVLRLSGAGESMKATVQFEEYGVKSLVVKFARLKPA
ncbi:MAG: UvrD-helicase domain-containing protein [bacterium]